MLPEIPKDVLDWHSVRMCHKLCKDGSLEVVQLNYEGKVPYDKDWDKKSELLADKVVRGPSGAYGNLNVWLLRDEGAQLAWEI